MAPRVALAVHSRALRAWASTWSSSRRDRAAVMATNTVTPLRLPLARRLPDRTPTLVVRVVRPSLVTRLVAAAAPVAMAVLAVQVARADRPQQQE